MATDTLDSRLVTIGLVVLAALVLFPLLFGVGMMTGGPMMGDHWGEWGHGAGAEWMFLLGLAMQVLFLVALGVGVYYLVRSLSDGGSRGSTDPALDELRRAYARGDLTDEEYERRRERLEGDETGRD